jgi:hypothetical protein
MNRRGSTGGIQVCLTILVLGACASNKDVRVQLDAHHQSANEPRQLNVEAQVTGPQSGLRYKWFSVLGEFEPQDSDAPKSSFFFSPSSARDRVWVEVWRENVRVAQAQLDVSMDSAPELPVGGSPPHLQIAITQIPRYDPAGGPDTRADIGGRITGELPKGYSVIVYARADAWYIQPVPYALHPIQSDNKWTSWTHTGSSYAALVVRNDYKPLTRLDVLPAVEGGVLARTIVEGKKP